MDKYSAMINKNKKKSDEMVSLAIYEIRKMLQENSMIVVTRLAKQTGISRAFFYNNTKVREELNRAQQLQQRRGFILPQKVILDKAMDKELEFLRRKLIEKDSTINVLQKEVENLKATVNEQQITILNSL